MTFFFLTLFDILLILTMLWLAWCLLDTEDIFKAVVLFISFGLLVALAWVRLRAPDVALAEAALGAGMTGPLFLSALRRMKRIRKGERRLDRDEHRGQYLTILLGSILWTFPGTPPGLADLVASHQEHSGVESPVTAVLLNFRSYDTLLEIMVLLLAVIGAWSLKKGPFPEQVMETSPVQMGVVRLLAPLMCLVAAYLVWQGGHLAGGAFQGGAILGGAGVLILVAELPWLQVVPVLLLRIGLVLGPLIFAGLALLCLFFTGTLLDYPEGTAGWLILLIEAACAISIGLTLALLFAGDRPEGDASEKYNRADETLNGDMP